MRNGLGHTRGRHERNWRVTTRKLTRGSWQGIYEINRHHFVLSRGDSEVNALKDLVRMMAERKSR